MTWLSLVNRLKRSIRYPAQSPCILREDNHIRKQVMRGLNSSGEAVLGGDDAQPPLGGQKATKPLDGYRLGVDDRKGRLRHSSVVIGGISPGL